MTQEEKAKAYDEALDRAKSFQQKFGGDYAGYIFPELRESEDERMRKMLIDRVRSAEELTDELREWILTYLEKQKEQKPAEWGEEDETYLGLIIECLVSCKYEAPVFADQYQSEIDWLKSLRPSSWKSKLLKEAVEGKIVDFGTRKSVYVINDQERTDMLDKYADGDKVLVIVLPKEDQNNG